MPTKQPKILDIKKADQYRTISELFERSQSDSIYYTLLILSAFIIACGILLNNAAIVIGGMLVTPVLTPLLIIGLALSVGNLEAMRSSVMLAIKSFLLIILVSFVLALIFGGGGTNSPFIFDNTLKAGVLYFIVAIVSGVAATFAWVRKEAAVILPGIAVSVSLVPPLSLLGISLSALEFQLAQFSFLILLFNFAGVILGSMMVFSLLKFYKNERTIEKEAHMQEEGQKKSAVK